MYRTVLIIEDDESDALELEMVLSELGVSSVIIVKNLKDAYLALERNKIHLIILDIFLKNNESGLDLLDSIKESKLPFIICTGFRDGFLFENIKKYKPEAYLIKPIEKLTIHNELNKILFSKNSINHQLHTESIIIKQDKELVKLMYSDIIAVKSEGNYCRFFTLNKNYLTRGKISILEDELARPYFIKVHRNAIVNSDKIKSIETTAQLIHLENGHTIAFAKKHLKTIENAFKD